MLAYFGLKNFTGSSFLRISMKCLKFKQAGITMIQKHLEESDGQQFSDSNKWKVRVGSFREEKSIRQDLNDIGLHFDYPINKVDDSEESSRLMHFQQKHYYLMPELYSSFRNQIIVSQVRGDRFRIIQYSQGRVQMAFEDCIQADLQNFVSLTLYKNGDYRLVSSETVHFWHQQERILEKYSVAV